LDGLPLAIELAAARVKVLSPSPCGRAWQPGCSLLTGGSRDLPQRQPDARAAMEIGATNLLSTAEQKAFPKIVGGLWAGAIWKAWKLCATPNVISTWICSTYVVHGGQKPGAAGRTRKGESRFVMLETIREYALEKLEASGEAARRSALMRPSCLVLAKKSLRSRARGGGGVAGAFRAWNMTIFVQALSG